ADDNARNPEGEIISNDMNSRIRHILDLLDPREARILRCRYGIDTDRAMTLVEVGSLPDINISKERVRQIEAKALRRIRQNKTFRDQLLDFAS
ncbi:MAG: RNA polymerase sigma factor RpoD, partial [Lachnospiraceae bacterium]|nr:RNA polymerase sigma factor RpoD [Lachnospiraceae bacterium]